MCGKKSDKMPQGSRNWRKKGIIAIPFSAKRTRWTTSKIAASFNVKPSTYAWWKKLKPIQEKPIKLNKLNAIIGNTQTHLDLENTSFTVHNKQNHVA